MDTPGRYITGPLGQQARPKVIELQQLTVSRTRQAILQEITLTLFEGEALALLAASAQEKNALLACLLGHIQPTMGTLRVLGTAVPPLPPEIRRQLGVMPQFVERKGTETVASYLQRFSAYHKVHLTDQQIARYCAHYQLTPHLLVKELSSLQARILALALALVHDPRLALLVEPLSDLEAGEQAVIQTYLQRAQREGRTLLCTGLPLDEKWFTEYDVHVRLAQGRLVHQDH